MTRNDRQVPPGWQVVRLEDVAEVNPRRPKLNVRAQTPVTFIPMAAVAEDCTGIISRGQRAYREIASGYTYFQEDDVLFAKITPCLQNGKHALATELKEGFGFGTTEFHVIRAGRAINPRHLFRVLTQRPNIEKCTRYFSGTAGQQRVQPETLKSLLILLPPLPEQRAIAAVLDSIDEAIERTEAIIAATERLRDALLHELLTRGVPGWHTEWKEVPGIGTIPACWEVVRLGDESERITKGTTPTTLGRQYTSSGVRFLRVENISDDGTITGGKLRFIDQDTHSILSRSILRGNDLVLSIAGALGRSALVTGDVLPANLNQALAIIRLSPASRILPVFLSYVLRARAIQEQINGMRVELAQANVSLRQVGMLRIPIPHFAEQLAIANTLDCVNAANRRAREERDRITSLKSSAADAMLTGRVRVTSRG